MNYIEVGIIVNTHGIKGELRIISDFKYKEEAFKKNRKVYLGNRKQEMVIESYRVHKIYDMVTFSGIKDINEAIIFKGDKVYVNRDDLVIDGYLNEDIIGFTVYNGKEKIGHLDSIITNKNQDLLVISHDGKNSLIPFVEQFVKEINIENKKIVIEAIDGLLNEN